MANVVAKEIKKMAWETIGETNDDDIQVITEYTKDEDI